MKRVRNGYSPRVHDEVGNKWFVSKCLWEFMSDDLGKGRDICTWETCPQRSSSGGGTSGTIA
jgi:hypothetical protein